MLTSYFTDGIVVLFAIISAACSLLDKNMDIPVVINTWAFVHSNVKAWDVVRNSGSALDAVEKGCSQCENDQCDFTVGYGGSPDENGETTLDAMIMDGITHDVGAVAGLRRVKHAISVARKVLENTEHTLLVGDLATQFAINMGFREENLSTPYSIDIWQKWKSNNCQPNFWKNVSPNPKLSCGPYKKGIQIEVSNSSFEQPSIASKFGEHSHDTIGMIVIDEQQNIAAGTSSNGATHKIPGRVGDSPIPGSGSYVDKDVGGAAATGDGDVMMRFLPSYNTVENMRRGMSPTDAARESVQRISKKYPSFKGAVIAISINGEYGAACHGLDSFPFSVSNPVYESGTVKKIFCT